MNIANLPKPKMQYTKIPDVILDDWLPRLSGAQIQVVLLVARKTYGWGKNADKLSTAQIAEGTGLVRSTVIKACNALEQKGYLLCTPSDLPNGHPKAVNTYSLDTQRNAQLAIETSTIEPTVERAEESTEAQEASPLPADSDSVTGPKKRRVTRPKKRPVQKSDGSEKETGAGPKIGRVVNRQPVRKSDPQQTRQTALQTAATEGPAFDAKTSPANAPFAAAAASNSSKKETKPSRPVEDALPPPDVSLLDCDEADIERLRKTNPAELVRRFREQNPAFADRMAKKAVTAHTSPNPLLARCIVEDWLPEIRSAREVPKPAPYRPPVNTTPAAFRARYEADRAARRAAWKLTPKPGGSSTERPKPAQ